MEKRAGEGVRELVGLLKVPNKSKARSLCEIGLIQTVPPPRFTHMPMDCLWDKALQVLIYWDSRSTVCVLFSWGNGLWLHINGSVLHPLDADPQQWTETHVRDWVMWAVNEFSLKGVDFQKFCMNGAALCALGKECFLELAPDFVGDILWEHLEILQKGESWCLQGEWLTPSWLA